MAKRKKLPWNPDTHEMTDDGVIIPRQDAEPATKVLLDLGAQSVSPPGFKPMGYDHGTEIYPLDVPDESVDVIRASHVLEHFPHSLVHHVLAHWASKLKPGGLLKVAVPNLQWIAENYLAGNDIMVQGYLMGGQTDEHDFHRCAFDEELLAEQLRMAGLIDVAPWQSDARDCSSLPVSLNLQAIKPRKVVPPSQDPFLVSAVMSVPRLGFMDNFFCSFEALTPMRIKIRRHMGAYWEVSLENTLRAAIEEDRPDAILTLDYDSVYTRSDVERLIQLMREHPEADAIAALQVARHAGHALMNIDLPFGVKGGRVTPSVFAGDLTKIRTAHFGLTLIRVSSLLKAKKPWLHSQPAPDGTWRDGRVDADMNFWKNWQDSGLSVYLANRIPIGHLENMIRWPAKDMDCTYQLPMEFFTKGKPPEAWS